jgi:hypothetical protein
MNTPKQDAALFIPEFKLLIWRFLPGEMPGSLELDAGFLGLSPTKSVSFFTVIPVLPHVGK